jgi:hypothetical protein
VKWLRIFQRDEGPPADVREAMRLNPNADHYHYGGSVCGDPDDYGECQRALSSGHSLPVLKPTVEEPFSHEELQRIFDKNRNVAGTSYRVGTHPSGGPLPVEAQVFLRVMGEDLSGARALLRDMPPLDRHVLLFWIEQMAGLVYEVDEREGF